jgi:hypothetical protein
MLADKCAYQRFSLASGENAAIHIRSPLGLRETTADMHCVHWPLEYA